MKKLSAVEWLAEKYNHITWLRNRDEISAGTADEWRKRYLAEAKNLEKEQIVKAHLSGIMQPLKMRETEKAEEYYKNNYIL